MLTRREFGRLTLAGLPGAAALGGAASPGGPAQSRPNSIVEGVSIGVTSHSFRGLPDRSAEAILNYIVQSGISAVELDGEPVESFAGAPGSVRAGAGAGAARGSGASAVSWLGEPCETPSAGGTGTGPKPAVAGPGRGQTVADRQAAQRERATQLKAWRTSVSMDAFKALRRLYNDAGVTILAWNRILPGMSDAELEYVFDVAAALGCTHTTLELPASAAQLKRIGDLALKKKIHAAYHTQAQSSLTAYDRAFAASQGNMANLDVGNLLAAGNVVAAPIQFLQKHHARIASLHLKDRTTRVRCGLNMAWGKGDTPIKDVLQLTRKNGWKFPATIELDYTIPPGSDAIKEVRKCFEYCRAALTSRP